MSSCSMNINSLACTPPTDNKRPLRQFVARRQREWTDAALFTIPIFTITTSLNPNMMME